MRIYGTATPGNLDRLLGVGRQPYRTRTVWPWVNVSLGMLQYMKPLMPCLSMCSCGMSQRSAGFPIVRHVQA